MEPTETQGLQDSEKRVDLDDFFPYVGEWGKYQKVLTWLIVLPACIPCGIQGFNQLFMSEDVEHWCRPPPFLLQNTNFTQDQLKVLLFPGDSQNEERSKCFIKEVDWSALQVFQKEGDNSAGDSFDLEEVDFSELVNELSQMEEPPTLAPCPNGWDYGATKTSIVADFDLVCGKEFYPTVALFLALIGGLCGVFFFGILTDLIGRKLSFFVCLTLEMIGGLGCAFAEDFWTWTIFRVINGLTVPAIYQIPFIICLELVGQSQRSFVTVMTCLFYVAGMMLLPLIAYVEREWRQLSIWTTAPFVLYYFYFWFLPESPRWLMAQNRTKEALAILETLAKVNGTSLPPHLLQRITAQSSESRRKEDVKTHPRAGVRDLFRTPNLRLKTILLTFCWFANASVYVGLSYYGPSIGENSYLSFFLGSAVEIPGYFLCWLLMDRMGRRWPLCLSMIIGGIFAIATVLLSPESNLLMTFYLIAKLGISASYLIVYPFGGELYPTEVRGVGLGFSAYVGGIGICCIPLINYLGRSFLQMPLVLMGVVSVVGGIVSLRLPETLGAALPTTIQEGEEFGKEFGWGECMGCGPAREGLSSSTASLDEGVGVEGERIRLNRMPTIDQVYSSVPLGEVMGGGVETPRRKRLVRQGSTLEAPTDSKGAIKITPWW